MKSGTHIYQTIIVLSNRKRKTAIKATLNSTNTHLHQHSCKLFVANDAMRNPRRTNLKIEHALKQPLSPSILKRATNLIAYLIASIHHPLHHRIEPISVFQASSEILLSHELVIQRWVNDDGTAALLEYLELE
jgi:hypothetical protein